MSGHLWNSSWLLNARLGSCRGVLLRADTAAPNLQQAGSGAFNNYYFGGNTYSLSLTESAAAADAYSESTTHPSVLRLLAALGAGT